MDNGTPYKSLFKSWNKSHHRNSEKLPNADEEHKQITVTAKTPRKSINEILSGRKSTSGIGDSSSPVVEGILGSEQTRTRRRVNDIIAQVNSEQPNTFRGDSSAVLRTSFDHIITAGVTNITNREESDEHRKQSVDSTRKSVIRIIAVGGANSTVNAPQSARRRTSAMAVHAVSHKPIADILSSTPRKTSISTESQEFSDLAQEPKETVAIPFVLSQSERMVFDFSVPNTINPQKNSLLNEAKQSVRLKLLHKMLGIGKNTSVIHTIFVLNRQDWRENSRFNALLYNMADCQTDNMIGNVDDECQTNETEMVCKWTQMPAEFTRPQKGTKPDFRLLKMDAIGVGPDPVPPLEDEKTIVKAIRAVTNPVEEEMNLLKFIKKTSKLMLTLLHSNTIQSVSSTVFGGNSNDETLFLEFGRGLQSLNQLAMHTLHCEGGLVACANVPPKDRNSKVRQHEVKNIVTVWSILDPGFPVYFLRVWGEVTIIRLVATSEIVVCGSHNGGINIWDLKEDEKIHTPFQDVYVRTPSFHTGCIEGENHHTRIIGLEILTETKSTAQIISMDKESVIICWSCIQTLGVEKEVSSNSAAWSKLRIQVRQVLKLSEMFTASYLITNCLNVWERDQKYFLVGTNNGFIGKGRIVPPELNSHCEKYCGDSRDSLIRIHHIDINIKLNVFMAACGDKCIRLFEMSRQKAVLCVECDEIPLRILWSQQRISVFYLTFKDEIAIWDLTVSDLKPIKVCPANGLQDLQLLFVDGQENMVMITHNGMKLSLVVPQCDLTPLTANFEKLVRHYISIN